MYVHTRARRRTHRIYVYEALTYECMRPCATVVFGEHTHEIVRATPELAL